MTSKFLRLACGVVALIAVLGMSSTASANTFTLVCQPAAAAAPPQWFGGPWSRALKVRVDTDAMVIELLDQDENVLATTLRASHLAGLGGYQVDVKVNDSAINWGVVRMWGTSGYVDRKTGQVDVLWATPSGFSPDTLIRQFHGTCRQR